MLVAIQEGNFGSCPLHGSQPGIKHIMKDFTPLIGTIGNEWSFSPMPPIQGHMPESNISKHQKHIHHHAFHQVVLPSQLMVVQTIGLPIPYCTCQKKPRRVWRECKCLASHNWHHRFRKTLWAYSRGRTRSLARIHRIIHLKEGPMNGPTYSVKHGVR